MVRCAKSGNIGCEAANLLVEAPSSVSPVQSGQSRHKWAGNGMSPPERTRDSRKMTLLHEGRVLYVSVADVSKPNGPGVNEREFMLSLFDKFGSRAHMLAPMPRYSCCDLNLEQTTFYPNPKKWDLFGFIRQQLQLKKEIHRLLAEQPFDLVVIRMGALPLGLYLARKMPAPYVLKTVGEVLGGAFADSKGFKRLVCNSLAGCNLFLVRNVIQGAIGLDACTEQLLQQHEETFGLARDDLLLCRNATNVHRHRPQATADAKAALKLSHFEPVLGYAGGKPAHQGGMQILAITARMIEDYPRLGAVIVGGDEDLLLKRARELGISDHVAIPGQLPYDRIPTYVNSFDVCFALDRPDRLRRVGNSHQKVRQYLACGKRVVSCGANDDSLLRGDLVRSVGSADTAAIEKATRELLQWDDDKQRRHAARCIAYARKHLSTEVSLTRRVDYWEMRMRRVRPFGYHARNAD